MLLLDVLGQVYFIFMSDHAKYFDTAPILISNPPVFNYIIAEYIFAPEGVPAETAEHIDRVV